MTIHADRHSKTAVIFLLDGRLDTASAPLLERKIKQIGDDITELILDFSGLTYISSMGLRVLLQTQKTMAEENRKLVIRNMSSSIREVFEMTGFINLMVQEEKFVVIRDGGAEKIRLRLIGTMDAVNVPDFSTELAQIKAANAENSQPVEIILDAARLESINESACKLLSDVIDSTAWEGRILRVENATGKTAEVLKAGGLAALLV
jgi:anti-sigma B factor antagonist